MRYSILLQHPHRFEVKVIDFGSACFESEQIYTYIQSRFYRAPEVLIGDVVTTAIEYAYGMYANALSDRSPTACGPLGAYSSSSTRYSTWPGAGRNRVWLTGGIGAGRAALQRRVGTGADATVRQRPRPAATCRCRPIPEGARLLRVRPVRPLRTSRRRTRQGGMPAITPGPLFDRC